MSVYTWFSVLSKLFILVCIYIYITQLHGITWKYMECRETLSPFISLSFHFKSIKPYEKRSFWNCSLVLSWSANQCLNIKISLNLLLSTVVDSLIISLVLLEHYCEMHITGLLLFCCGPMYVCLLPQVLYITRERDIHLNYLYLNAKCKWILIS